MARYFRNPDAEFGYTYYTVAGDTPVHESPDEDYKEYPSARVTVRHARYDAIFDQGGRRRFTHWYGPEPTTLFSEDPPVIDTASSHTSMRPHVPLLLGMAMKEFPSALPSHSLSQHSSRLVQKAIKKGLVKPSQNGNPEANVTNTMDFDDYDNTVDSGSLSRTGGIFGTDSRLSDTDVRAARQNLRNMLRPKRVQGPHYKVTGGQQFTQLQLPGMEDM